MGPWAKRLQFVAAHISWPAAGQRHEPELREPLLIDGAEQRARGDTARRTQPAGAQRASCAAVSRLARHAGVDEEAGSHASACAEG